MNTLISLIYTFLISYVISIIVSIILYRTTKNIKDDNVIIMRKLCKELAFAPLVNSAAILGLLFVWINLYIHLDKYCIKIYHKLFGD
jgi:ABC-type sugar transport system permease subunit